MVCGEECKLASTWFLAVLLSCGGRGLFLRSLSVVVEEVGVPWFELMGDCV